MLQHRTCPNPAIQNKIYVQLEYKYQVKSQETLNIRPNRRVN